MKVTPNLLRRVALDNKAVNQVGDNIRDGVGWDIGHDLGLMTPDEAERLPISPEAARGIAPAVGKKALTIAQMNANEQAHIAKARVDRRASGF